MTVAELIKVLETFPQDAVIIVADNGEGIAWIMDSYDSPYLSDITEKDRKYFNDERLENVNRAVYFC